MVAPARFELAKCRSQSPMPYRLAMGQAQYNYNIISVEFQPIFDNIFDVLCQTLIVFLYNYQWAYHLNFLHL